MTFFPTINSQTLDDNNQLTISYTYNGNPGLQVLPIPPVKCMLCFNTETQQFFINKIDESDWQDGSQIIKTINF